MQKIQTSKDLTIVIQGPLNHKGTSTEMLIRNLAEYVPLENLILSIPENDAQIQTFRMSKINVVRYKTFEPYQDVTRDHFVRNMISGVRSGLKFAKTKFAMRIRSDHSNFQIKPVIEFPYVNNPMDFYIGVSSFGTHHRANGQFRVGCISDHLHIGSVSSLLSYWEWDDFSENYIIERNKFPWGFQPSFFRYYMEQILYFSWRHRAGLTKSFRKPSRQQFEKEFRDFFGIITNDVVHFNLSTNLDNWQKFSKKGDFLKIESPAYFYFDFNQWQGSILDSINRWKAYLKISRKNSSY